MSKPRGYSAKTKARLADAWKTIANTPEGALVIADLMVWCNAYTMVETNDPYELQRLTGENNVAKRIAGFLGYQPVNFAAKADEDLELLNRMVESFREGQAAH
jgi:hypothetical protein